MNRQAYNRSLFELRHGASGYHPSERERKRLAWTADLVPADDAATVLDAGCGRGELAEALVERGLLVTAVDLSAAGLASMRARRIVGALDRLPFRDASFDVVVCAEVIEHLGGERQRALEELWRVSRRYVLITVPAEEKLEDAFVRCEHCGTVFNAWGHVSSFDEHALRALLPAAPRRIDGLRFKEPGYLRPLLLLRNRVLGAYADIAGAMCSRCGRVAQSGTTRSLPVKVLDRINHHLGAQRQVGWLAALWCKQDC